MTKTLDYSESDLYLTRWKPYLDKILNTKEISFECLLSNADIRNFDFAKKYRINGVDFLISEIKVPISSNNIGVCTIEGIKV